MSEKNIQSFGTKSVPSVIKFECVFNVRIILIESNYDVWSQLMKMHIVKREKLLSICGKTKSPMELEDEYEKWYAKKLEG